MLTHNIYPNSIASVRVPFGLAISMWTMNGWTGTKTVVGGEMKGIEDFVCYNLETPKTAKSLSVYVWYPPF